MAGATVAAGATRAPVQLSSPIRHPGLLLIPLLLMLALRSARGVCRLVQGAIPLTGLLVPLAVQDAVELQSHQTR